MVRNWPFRCLRIAYFDPKAMSFWWYFYIFIKWAQPDIFLFFSNSTFLEKNYRLQQDSNWGCRSRQVPMLTTLPAPRSYPIFSQSIFNGNICNIFLFCFRYWVSQFKTWHCQMAMEPENMLPFILVELLDLEWSEQLNRSRICLPT